MDKTQEEQGIEKEREALIRHTQTGIREKLGAVARYETQILCACSVQGHEHVSCILARSQCTGLWYKCVA